MTTGNATRLVVVTFLSVAVSQAPALTLDAALARVLEKNPAILEAHAGLEQAAGRRVILRAASLPDARIQIPAGVQGGRRAGEKEGSPRQEDGRVPRKKEDRGWQAEDEALRQR